MTLDDLAGRIHAGDLDGVLDQATAWSAKERAAWRRRADEVYEAVNALWGPTLGERRAGWDRVHPAWFAYLLVVNRRHLGSVWSPLPDEATFQRIVQRVGDDWVLPWAASRGIHHLDDCLRIEALGYAVEHDEAWIQRMIVAGSWIRSDPESLQRVRPDVWRLFEVQGSSEASLAGHDKYGDNAWSDILITWMNDGTIDRDRLLDATLDALSRGFVSFRASWFRQFHDRLGPTRSERAARAERYVDLLASDDGPTRKLALDAIGMLEPASFSDEARLVEALGPAALVKAKGTALLAVAQIGRFSARRVLDDHAGEADVERWSRAIEAYGVALAHPHRDVQAAVLRAVHMGLSFRAAQRPPSEFIAIVQGWPELVHASLRDDAVAIVRACAPEGETATADRDRGPTPEAQPAVPGRPLLAEEVPRGPTTVDALRLAWLRALEAPEDVIHVEATLGASVRCAHPKAGDDAMAGPLGVRIRQVLDGGRNQLGFPLALVAHAWVTGREATAWGRTSTTGPAFVTPHEVGPMGWMLRPFLATRCQAIAAQIASGLDLPLLSTPTRRDGTLDVDALLARAGAWDDAGHTPAMTDLITALARVDLRSGRPPFPGDTRRLYEARRTLGPLRALVWFTVCDLDGRAPGGPPRAPALVAELGVELGLMRDDDAADGIRKVATRWGRGSTVPWPALDPPAWEPGPVAGAPGGLRCEGRHLASTVGLGLCPVRASMQAAVMAAAWSGFEEPTVAPGCAAWSALLLPTHPEPYAAWLASRASLDRGAGSDKSLAEGYRHLGAMPGPFGPWTAWALGLAMCGVAVGTRALAAELAVGWAVAERLPISALGEALAAQWSVDGLPCKRFLSAIEPVQTDPASVRALRPAVWHALRGEPADWSRDVSALLAWLVEADALVGPCPRPVEATAFLGRFRGKGKAAGFARQLLHA